MWFADDMRCVGSRNDAERMVFGCQWARGSFQVFSVVLGGWAQDCLLPLSQLWPFRKQLWEIFYAQLRSRLARVMSCLHLHVRGGLSVSMSLLNSWAPFVSDSLAI